MTWMELNDGTYMPDMVDGVDLTGALARLRDNKGLYLKLVKSFFNSDFVAQVKTALAAGNYADARLHAHSLKGSAANLGMESVRALAEKLEHSYAAGINNEDTQKNMTLVMSDLARVREAFRI